MLLYSLLIAQQVLFGVKLVTWLLLVSLVWRFVIAAERIADSME